MLELDTKMQTARRRRIGIVGGLGTLGGVDILFKLVRATTWMNRRDQMDLLFEQRPFDEPSTPGGEAVDQVGRKAYALEIIQSYVQREVDSVLLPCFISHTFLDELQDKVDIPILSIMDALRSHLQRKSPNVRRIGVLTSSYVRKCELFEKHLKDHEVIYPSPGIQNDCLMRAIYGNTGIKYGDLRGDSLDLLERACRDLMALGSELIVPGFTEISVVFDALRERGLPIIDTNHIYALHVISHQGAALAKYFKLGLLGGLGPATVVDLKEKIAHCGNSSKNSDRVKMILETQTPVADWARTALAPGLEPTIPLHSACKRLEHADVDAVVIPFYLSQVFIDRVKAYVSVPIISLLTEVIEFVAARYPSCKKVGLLAETKLIQTQVFDEAFAQIGVECLVPEETGQAEVMEVIQGETGVQSGFNDDACRESLLCIVQGLIEQGADVIVVGSTHLSLALSGTTSFSLGQRIISIIDPLDVLAKKCVWYADREAS
jgi:aspartate racemase